MVILELKITMSRPTSTVSSSLNVLLDLLLDFILPAVETCIWYEVPVILPISYSKLR